MDNNNFVVIMAGGIGSRFWPFSRTNFPKQFHDVLGTGKTLIQQTAERFDNICPKENIYVVTNKEYYSLVKEQLPFMGDEQILLEPEGKNTAPCVAYASYKIKKKNADATIIVAPADHIILKEQVFEERTLIGLDAAKANPVMVTLGIEPSRPDTGYGYIKFHQSEEEVKKVANFTEKPNLEKANEFVSSGEYVWNAGIFIWHVDTVISELEKHEPELATQFEEGTQHWYETSEDNFIADVYGSCKSISIDYALMERSECVFVVLSDFGWSDLGTWKSLYEIKEKDNNNNVLDGQIMSYDTKDCIIKTPKDQLVVVQGLDNFIVAEYDNVLMICQKDQEQRVKEFVTDIKEKKMDEYY